MSETDNTTMQANSDDAELYLMLMGIFGLVHTLLPVTLNFISGVGYESSIGTGVVGVAWESWLMIYTSMFFPMFIYWIAAMIVDGDALMWVHALMAFHIMFQWVGVTSAYWMPFMMFMLAENYTTSEFNGTDAWVWGMVTLVLAIFGAVFHIFTSHVVLEYLMADVTAASEMMTDGDMSEALHVDNLEWAF